MCDQRRLFPIVFAFLFSLLAADGMAAEILDQNRRIPEEYESAGDHSLGMNSGGIAAVGGLAAIRLNPAMLALEPVYSIVGGYHWPTRGREFYQAGVVDSKTSNLAAGFMYTSFTDDFLPSEGGVYEGDSPIKRRASLGLAQTFKVLSVGISGHFVEAHDLNSLESDALVKGTTIGMGVAGILSPQIRFGVSAENLANRKVADYAPRTTRAGLAYMFGGGNVTAHLDYRTRDRVEIFEGDDPVFGIAGSESDPDKGKEKPEQAMIGSFSARVYDVLRLLGGYSQNLTDDRQSIAGGVAIVNGTMSLSYTASRPDMRNDAAHQAINLGINVSI